MTTAILDASQPNSLTIFTMLGGRASVVDLHLKSLDKYTSKHTRKVCLLPSKDKIKTLALCSQYDDDFQFLSREDFGSNATWPTWAWRETTVGDMISPGCGPSRFYRPLCPLRLFTRRDPIVCFLFATLLKQGSQQPRTSR